MNKDMFNNNFFDPEKEIKKIKRKNRRLSVLKGVETIISVFLKFFGVIIWFFGGIAIMFGIPYASIRFIFSYFENEVIQFLVTYLVGLVEFMFDVPLVIVWGMGIEDGNVLYWNFNYHILDPLKEKIEKNKELIEEIKREAGLIKEETNVIDSNEEVKEEIEVFDDSINEVSYKDGYTDDISFDSNMCYETGDQNALSSEPVKKRTLTQ